ncbi:PREDICTED: transcription factor SPT20 homolog [Condylura cristata]|uniref:transcription factor SPT20 homolog n=1 Tax=Condylura cristata TaxID=143302 RepID=UPI00064354BB|nr:PREDICTED: transcription factor SPT20 homolog [Condylura cristata]
MQQALERALGRAESVIESAQQRPPKRKCSPGGEQSLHDKLYDIYVEECAKEPAVAEELRSNVNLLEKLVAREALPCLVVNLYPGEEGYSLMLRGAEDSSPETIRLPYEDGQLLEYLDAEQLPPVLVDLLEKSEMNLFHRGCVIAEVRDYRQAGAAEPPGYQSRHVLLRPGMQTLAADVHAIAGDDPSWSQDDKLLLESELLLATAEPLCLDPSVAVACTENRLLYNKQKMNTRPMKQNFRRHSVPSLTREQAVSPWPLPAQLRALTSWGKARERRAVQQYDLKISKAGDCVDTWKQRRCDLAVPSEVDVDKYAKGRKSARPVASQASVRPVREVKERSVSAGEAGSAPHTTKPTFMQPLSDPRASAERSREEARCQRQGSLPDHPSTQDHSYSFMPGSETDAGMFIYLSEELDQKKAPSPVRMSSSRGGSSSLSQFSPGEETQQPKTTLVQSSVLEKDVKHLPSPIQLLPSPGKSSSGKIFIPGQASSILKSLSSALASKSPSVSQKSSEEVDEGNKIPAALSTVSSSQRTPDTPVMADSPGLDIISVVGPVLEAQALASGSHPIQGSTPEAITPGGIKLSNQPAAHQKPSVQPGALQEPSQVGVQLFIENAPNLKPVTLLHLSKGSLVLKNEQLSQQQQWLCQLIEPQGQHPSMLCRQQDPSVPESNSYQQAIVINLSGLGSLQAQPDVWSQHGCGQSTAGQSLPEETPIFLCLEEASTSDITESASAAVEDLASDCDDSSSPRSSATSATSDSRPVHRGCIAESASGRLMTSRVVTAAEYYCDPKRRSLDRPPSAVLPKARYFITSSKGWQTHENGIGNLGDLPEFLGFTVQEIATIG